MSNPDFDRGYAAGIKEAIELLRVSEMLGKNVKAETLALQKFLGVSEGGTGRTLDEGRGKVAD